MDLITKSNGLIHISLKIFKLLDYQTLMACRNVDRHFFNALDNPKFWIEKIPTNIKSNSDLKSDFSIILSHIRQLDKDSIFQLLKSDAELSMTKLGAYKDLEKWDRQKHFPQLKRALETQMTKCLIFQFRISKNFTLRTNTTVAHIFAKFGGVHMLKVMKFYGNKNFSQYNVYGYLPIHEAAWRGRLNVIKYLTGIEGTLDLLKTDGRGRNIIHLAATRGHLQIIEHLSKLIGDINIPMVHERKTPIILACEKGHIEVVKFMVPISTNPFASDNQGLNPLHIAASQGHANIVRYLLNKGLSPDSQNYDGKTSIYLAAQNNHTTILKVLYQFSKSPMAGTNDGLNPLFIAIRNGHDEVVKFICKNNPINLITECSPINQTNALHFAAESGRLDILKDLFPKFNNVLAPSNDGWTPVHTAAYHGHVDILRYLSKFVSDLNAPTIGNQSLTPLEIANKSGHIQIIQFLKEILSKEK